MTEPKDPKNVADYLEFKYPHVLPEIEIASVLTPTELSNLTPLEHAFVLWFIETNDSETSFRRLIHPAHYFDLNVINVKALMTRPLVRETIKKVKRDCPYLKMYSLDYIAGVMHDEVQYLRFTNRNPRYYGDGFREEIYNSRKSRQEQELAEIAMLKDYLELLVRMNEAVTKNESANPEPSGKNSSIDRILAEARDAIDRREKTMVNEAGGNPPTTAGS